jgi:hypothetical protein
LKFIKIGFRPFSVEIIEKTDLRNLSAYLQNLSADLQNLSADPRNLSADLQNLSADPRNLSEDLRNLSADLSKFSENQKKHLFISVLLKKLINNAEFLLKMNGYRSQFFILFLTTFL